MRKLFYIQPKLQKSFALLYTFITSTEIILFGIFALLFEKLSTALPVDLRLYYIFSVFFLLIALISAVNFWLSTRLSHRVAGPLIQFERVLQNAISGNYQQRIRLRSSDYLHDIGDSLNLLLENLDRNREECDTKNQSKASKVDGE
jgi:nitrogen fixation/metabolism regulation signal transduction histidine kinase